MTNMEIIMLIMFIVRNNISCYLRYYIEQMILWLEQNIIILYVANFI